MSLLGQSRDAESHAPLDEELDLPLDLAERAALALLARRVGRLAAAEAEVAQLVADLERRHARRRRRAVVLVDLEVRVAEVERVGLDDVGRVLGIDEDGQDELLEVALVDRVADAVLDQVDQLVGLAGLAALHAHDRQRVARAARLEPVRVRSIEVVQRTSRCGRCRSGTGRCERQL